MAWSIVSPTGTSATINSSGKLTYPANTGETDITWVVKYTYNDGVQNRETTKILTQGQNSSSCSIVVESYDILQSVTVLDNPPSYTFTGNTIEFAADTYCRCAFAVFSTNGEVGSNLYLDSSENVGEVWIRDCEIVFGAIIGNHKSGSDVGRIVVHNDCGESAVFTVKYYNKYEEFDLVAYLGGCCATGDCVNRMTYVDLCLPSGNWWSTRDLDNNYTGGGQGSDVYCSWGNQEFRASSSVAPFSQANYNGTSGETKYNGGTSISQGSSDDVVRTSIGCRWVLPTPDDWQELFDNCTVTYNGNNFTLTSKINGVDISFLKWGYYIDYEVQWGKSGYWTTERATNGAKMAIINAPDASCDDCQNVLTIESKEPYYGARLRGILKKP